MPSMSRACRQRPGARHTRHGKWGTLVTEEMFQEDGIAVGESFISRARRCSHDMHATPQDAQGVRRKMHARHRRACAQTKGRHCRKHSATGQCARTRYGRNRRRSRNEGEDLQAVRGFERGSRDAAPTIVGTRFGCRNASEPAKASNKRKAVVT